MPSKSSLGFSKSYETSLEEMGFSSTHRRSSIDEPYTLSEDILAQITETQQYFPDLTFTGDKIESLTVGKLTAGTIYSQKITLGVVSADGDVWFNAGKTDFDDTINTGFILGLDDSDNDEVKFHIGSTASYLDWNVTTADTLTIVGSITASSGAIGGWVIGADYLRDAAGVVGMSSAVTGADDIRFWAGDATMASAEFRVYESGALVASSATITGSVTATSGAIGGWVIGADYIRDVAGVVGLSSAVTGADDIRFWAGDATMGSAEFRVYESGALVASSATITGSITATSGDIGGWVVEAGYIYNLQSGTPTAVPSDGVVLASGNEAMIIYEDAAKRLEVGYLSAGIYGMRVYATDGTTVIWETSDTQQMFAGWDFNEAYFWGLASGTPTASPNDGIVLASGSSGGVIVYEDTAKRVEVGYLSAGVYGLKGYATDGTTDIFELSDTQQMIAGWNFTDTVLRSGSTDANSNVLIDSANSLIRLGPTTGNYLTLDGANLRVRTSTFAAGLQGWSIETDGSAEFANITARGEFHSQVLSYNEVHTTAGSQLIATSAGKLRNDVTSDTSPATFNVDIDDPDTGHTQVFSVSDILYVKDGSGNANYWTISSVSDETTFFRYVCTKNNGSNATFRAGAAIVDLGQSGNGYLYLTADDANGPFYSVRTHAGSPWATTTERLRVGNLNGYLGYAAEIYGLGVGSSGAGEANITIDPTNGIRIRTGTTDLFTVDMAGAATISGWSIDADSITSSSGAVGLSSEVTGGDDIRFWAGDSTPGSAEFRVYESGALVASSATITGSITATSGAIGGWTIGADYIRDAAGVVGMSSAVTGGDDIRFWAGDATMSSAEFRVYESGALVASSATITGSVTATSGAIGGFDIGADYIRDAADSFGMASTVTGGDDVRFWAGDTYANRATADFNVTEAGVLTATSAVISGTINEQITATAGEDLTAGDRVCIRTNEIVKSIATHDARTNEAAAGTNYASDTTAVTGANNAAGTADNYFFVKFDLASIAITTADKAYIRVNFSAVSTNVSDDYELNAYQVTSADWDESTITWTNKPTISASIAGSWEFSEASSITDDYLEESASPTGTSHCYIDITTLYNSWKSGTANYGVAIRLVGRVSGTEETTSVKTVTISTSENATSSTEPTLIVSGVSDNVGKAYKANATNFTDLFGPLGIATTTTSSGNTATIQRSGIVTNQSGLTAGKVYYITDSETLSTTPGTIIKAMGTALSATSLFIDDNRNTIVTDNIRWQSSSSGEDNDSTNTMFIPLGFRPKYIRFDGTVQIATAERPASGVWYNGVQNTNTNSTYVADYLAYTTATNAEVSITVTEVNDTGAVVTIVVSDLNGAGSDEGIVEGILTFQN